MAKKKKPAPRNEDEATPYVLPTGFVELHGDALKEAVAYHERPDHLQNPRPRILIAEPRSVLDSYGRHDPRDRGPWRDPRSGRP